METIEEHIDKMERYLNDDIDKLYVQTLKTKRFELTLNLFKGFSHNNEDFKFIISGKVWKFYNFDAGYEYHQFMWQSIENMFDDLLFQRKNFKIISNGLFQELHFSNKKNKCTLEEIEKFCSLPQGWAI